MHNIIYSSFLCILKMNNIHKWPLSTQCKQELWKKNPASFDVYAVGGGMQTTPDAGPSLVEEDHAQRKFPSLPIWRVSAFRQLFLDISTNIIPINAGVGGFHRRCTQKSSSGQRSVTPKATQHMAPAVQIWAGDSSSGWEQATTEAWKTTSLPRLELVDQPELSYQQHLLQVWLLHTWAVVPEGDKKIWQQPGWL